MDVTTIMYALAVAIYKLSVGIVNFVGQYQDKGPLITNISDRFQVRTISRWNIHFCSHLTSCLLTGCLHWGQYLMPSFTALQYKEHDSEFVESSEFKKIAENFDPDQLMWNDSMNQTIWSVV